MTKKTSIQGFLKYLFVSSREEPIPIEEVNIVEEDNDNTSPSTRSRSRANNVDKFFAGANYILGFIFISSFLALLYAALFLENKDAWTVITNAFTLTLGWFLNAYLQYIKSSLD